jgi:hypothetical protein
VDDAMVHLDADLAAITSSPALQFLELPSNIGPECAHTIFPPQRQCNNLRDLAVDVAWLVYDDAIADVVAACPHLRHLGLDCTGGGEVQEIAATTWAFGLLCLTALRELTQLRLGTMEMEVAPPAFAALAALTGLRDLSLAELEGRYLGGMLRLTACSQLTRLAVTATVFDAGGIAQMLAINVTNKVIEYVGTHGKSKHSTVCVCAAMSSVQERKCCSFLKQNCVCSG